MTQACDSEPAPATGQGPAGLTSRRLVTWAVALSVAMLLVAAGCSLVGTAQLTWDIWTLRIVRLAVAALVGAALAAAGLALQGMLRNPLAEPYILGISTGAGVGVLAAALLAAYVSFPTWLGQPAVALLGALASCVVVYAIAQRRGRVDPYALVLAGVIVNVFNGAVILTLMLFLQRNELLAYIGWSMGRLPNWTDRYLLAVAAAAVIIGWLNLIRRGAAFNCLGLGDEVASSAGVSVARLRLETFFVVGLITAASVSIAGPIGFVGLIIPHLCRLALGPDHRLLAVVSGFVGAIALMAADTAGRVAGAYLGVGEIPVGILTALAGGPFFLFLLRRRLTGAGDD